MKKQGNRGQAGICWYLQGQAEMCSSCAPSAPGKGQRGERPKHKKWDDLYEPRAQVSHPHAQSHSSAQDSTAAVTHPWAGDTGDHSGDCVGLQVMVAARPKLCSLRGHSACVIPWVGGHSPKIEFICLPQGQHLPPSLLPVPLLLLSSFAATIFYSLIFYDLLLPIKLL